MPDWTAILVAAIVGVAFGLALRAMIRRRLGQAAELARAEVGTELATTRERLAGRDEQLAEARSGLEAARAKLDELAARDSELRSRLAESETRLAEEREQSAEKLALLEAAEKKLADAFARLSQDALSANSESFLKLARQAFDTLKTSAEGDLDKRRQAIESLLAPMKEQLGRYESGVRELEKARQDAYGSLRTQVEGLRASQQSLLDQTSKLVTALRRPEVRGSWGEVQLRRSVEFAGMVEHVDFLPQVTVEGDEGRLRPDMLVKLPGGKQVVVDAKVPLDAYLAAVEAQNDDERREALIRHARQVRTHLGKLAEKAYWKQFDEAPEFVVLFLPGEAIFSAALEHDPGLIEDSFRQSVLITTPATLVALLKTVHYGWRQEAIARNAREISQAAATLYDRIRVFTEHFAKIGKGLEDSIKAYNAAVGSYERKVLPQGRRIERLGSTIPKTIEEPQPVDLGARELAAGNDDEPGD